MTESLFATGRFYVKTLFTLVLTDVNTIVMMVPVTDSTPTFLLDNPDLVLPVAPWCVALNNLELGILLLTQPWLAGGGLARSDLERQLSRLAAELPVGQVYFQRVNRAVATLEERRQLVREGSRRGRRFALTPEGFGALMLNLQVLLEDPTVDGREFEFKRALVAMGNVALERILDLPPAVSLGPELKGWFERVDALEVWGRSIMTPEVQANAFDILRLVGLQRGRVEELQAAAVLRVEKMKIQEDLTDGVDLSALGVEFLAGSPLSMEGRRELLRVARTLAAAGVPTLMARSVGIRYRAYLAYLDELADLYASELSVVDLGSFRRAMAERVG